MYEKLKKFNELLKKDKSLQKQLQKSKNEDEFTKLYCQLAKQKGYEIGHGELKSYLKTLKRDNFIKQPLTQDDLSRLAGGLCPVTTENPLPLPPPGECPVTTEIQ